MPRQCSNRIPGRFGRGPIAAIGALLILLAGTGCQSHEPRPLNPAAHRAAWHRRALQELVDRLDRSDTALGGYDPADGLTLREAQLVALAYHPDLRLARLRRDRAKATADNAALWQDPVLSASVLRIVESVANPWVISPTLGLSIPLSGRLGSEQSRADALERAAAMRVLASEWRVLYDVRQAWLEWSADRLRIAETERLVEVLGALVEAVSQLAEAGELSRAEAALFTMERARRRNELRRLRGDVSAGEQRIHASLGLPPEADASLVPSLAFDLPENEATPAEIARRNPELARLREEYEAAEATLRREIREQYPDLMLGPAYESDEGQSRWGLSFDLPLPLWNANRRAIAEARVDREIARAAFETEYERLVGRWAQARARARALAEQRAELEENLVPMVDAQLEDARRLLELGEDTGLVMLTSLTRAHETKLELIEVRRSEISARAELDYLVGPLAPEEAVDSEEDTP